jgi:phage shock protein PspC (stress-responsive transcriptional regulator)
MNTNDAAIYCSRDDRMILGLCGGLAHRFNVPVAAVRFLAVLSAFFFVGFAYFVGFFLPARPTKASK